MLYSSGRAKVRIHACITEFTIGGFVPSYCEGRPQAALLDGGIDAH